ncbi:DUF7533 family protein [Natronolimnohabitans innermongolicus]|uniref:Uncharacterized protein n=1 Tax=Natronolimnohabitans innermongolicus JCM 12255 TaxID=1227499 RepID=L9WUH7_9EURY|nr:hypothetical protein [Natronolimnohabitans innermongolicus]ELY53110.1 hypothetical protein C493_15103 [Natronolimnohabitans innermongolicus JCM 12255]
MAGLIDTIKLAGVLVLAIPAALAGLEFLLVRGETTTGAILLGLSVGLVLVQHRLTTPGDLPGLAAKRVAGSVVGDSSRESDDEDVVDVPRDDER